MIEFKVIEELEPRNEILEVIKDYQCVTTSGAIKVILHTNLKVIVPTTYQIKYPTKLTILEYKVNEISDKSFCIKEHNKKYNLKEIIQTLKNIRNLQLMTILLAF